MDLDAQRRRMIAGEIYDDLTPELIAARGSAVRLTDAYNASFGRPQAERETLLAALVKSAGPGAHFEPGFRCEFGFNIALGKAFYANFDCVILDAAPVIVADEVLFGPRVGIYTANHAIHPEERAAGACHARPVVIGDRVWVGGGVNINPGVTIGAGAIIGSGSVVTRDIPPGVIAAGVPCRTIREITEADRTGFGRSTL